MSNRRGGPGRPRSARSARSARPGPASRPAPSRPAPSQRADPRAGTAWRVRGRGGSWGLRPRSAGGGWLVLFIGLAALTAGCTFQYGLAYLIPALRHEGSRWSLVGLLVACTDRGLLPHADRLGRGRRPGGGSGSCCRPGWARRGDPAGRAGGPRRRGPGRVPGPGGRAGGLGFFAASGRLILGWFARSERGLAMGIRQSAQAAGRGHRRGDAAHAGRPRPRGRPLLFLVIFCLAAAAAGGDRGAGPGPASASTGPGAPGLAVPQAGAVAHPPVQRAAGRCRSSRWATYALVFLVDARHWDPASAGRLLAAAQAACGRPAGSGPATGRTGPAGRMRPMRILAVTTGAAMLALAGAAAARSPVAVGILLVCAVVSGEHQRASVHGGGGVRGIGVGGARPRGCRTRARTRSRPPRRPCWR